MVEALAGVGIPQDDICHLIINPFTKRGISKSTLHRHFRQELDEGNAKAKAKIGETLFGMMGQGNVAAAIFLAKVRLGWSEKLVVEQKESDGRSISDIDRDIERVTREIEELEAQITGGTTDGDEEQSPSDVPSLH
jgi:hypothetical protein